ELKIENMTDLELEQAPLMNLALNSKKEELANKIALFLLPFIEFLYDFNSIKPIFPVFDLDSLKKPVLERNQFNKETFYLIRNQRLTSLNSVQQVQTGQITSIHNFLHSSNHDCKECKELETG